MKLIKAVIKPFKLEAVRVALEALHVYGMTVSDARGMGRQKGHIEIYRGSEYVVGLLPKTVVEIVTADEEVDTVISALSDAAATGRIGDGKVFVLPVERAVRIRTDERDLDAL